jgi:dCTP deaminase
LGIISDSLIQQGIDNGSIKIEPFYKSCLGPNSYDIHLGDTLKTYVDTVYDPKKPNPPVSEFKIPEAGFTLGPGKLYLGVTMERTSQVDLLPYVDGKSSVGRGGLFIHVTAGRGDVSFDGFWTLELVAVSYYKVYAGMPIGQITFHEVTGKVDRPYIANPNSKYVDAQSKCVPVESRMWQNFKGGSWIDELRASPVDHD